MKYLISIVGMRFRDRYENHIYLLREDLNRARGFKLEFEKENKHDEFAIKALMNLDDEWYHFGYVSRTENRPIEFRNLIENGPGRIELSRSTSNTNVVKLRVWS